MFDEGHIKAETSNDASIVSEYALQLLVSRRHLLVRIRPSVTFRAEKSQGTVTDKDH